MTQKGHTFVPWSNTLSLKHHSDKRWVGTGLPHLSPSLHISWSFFSGSRGSGVPSKWNTSSLTITLVPSPERGFWNHLHSPVPPDLSFLAIIRPTTAKASTPYIFSQGVIKIEVVSIPSHSRKKEVFLYKVLWDPLWWRRLNKYLTLHRPN